MTENSEENLPAEEAPAPEVAAEPPVEETAKKGRGRPTGVRDSKPREIGRAHV